MRAFIAVLLLGSIMGCQAQEGKHSLATKQDSVSYGIGLNIGRSITRDSISISYEALVMGMKDAAVDSAKRLLSAKTCDSVMTRFQQEMREKQMEAAKQQGVKNLAEGEAFLAQNKTKEGVVETPTGLQYKVLTQGHGAKPKASQTVTVHYRGQLLSGKVFDSSYDRGEPVTFPVGGVIPGWTEALQLMPVGSHWQLWIPAQLAYGERGAGEVIPPNAVLMFEVELIAVK